ncbi:MAG: phosphatase [Thermovirgaceae bacterium]|nr:phosphatase [Thermovirgaceae bacterium]
MRRTRGLAMRGALMLGAIDAGSNSVRCLAVSSHGGVLEYIGSGAWITRLTEGIGGGRYEVRPDALGRTAAAVREARSLLDRAGAGPENMMFFATESLRGAVNGRETGVELERASGLPLRILQGAEEAVLSRSGALLGTKGADCVFDLGGGSLEIGGAYGSVSIPAGAVRMQARFGEDAGAIREEVLALLAGSLPGVTMGLAGVGGTSSAVVMMLEGVPVLDYHPACIHGHKVTSADLEELFRNISGTPMEERNLITGLEPKRADIIAAGIIVIRTVLEAAGQKGYTHSETDLLWSMCAEMASARGFAASAAKMR